MFTGKYHIRFTSCGIPFPTLSLSQTLTLTLILGSVSPGQKIQKPNTNFCSLLGDLEYYSILFEGFFLGLSFHSRGQEDFCPRLTEPELDSNVNVRERESV